MFVTRQPGRALSVLLLATTALVAGCDTSDSGGESSRSRSLRRLFEETPSAQRRVRAVADRLDCTDRRELSTFLVPYGLGLDHGIECRTDSVTIHVFAGDPSVKRTAPQDILGGFGVSDGGDVQDAPCPDWLVANDELVVAVPDAAAASNIRAALDELDVELVQPNATPTSYALPSGCGDVVAYADEDAI